MRLIVLDKVQSFFLRDNIDTANPVSVCHPVYLVSNSHKLRSECCGDELRICHVCQTTNHIYK